MDASRGSSSGSAIYPMPQIPALLFAPPPPATALPSSSLSLSSYSSSSSLRGHAPPITSFPILLLTVLGILAASALLLAYYVFVIRCCLTWHRDRVSSVAGLDVSRRPRRTRTASTASGTSIQASGGAAPDEPRGLEDAAIRALPAFSYRKKPAAAAAESPSAPATECAVCLGEFEEDDTVRMLPACLHVFHLACVDAWLQDNASCPLCRADVVAAHWRLLPPPPPPEEDDVVANIQVVVIPGAEEDQDALPRQREAAVAPAEFEQDTCTDRQVAGDKTQSTIDIDGGHGIGITVTERKDGDVLTPMTRSSFPMDDGNAVSGGGEVHLHIQSIILQGDKSLP